jgi:hypothetical protein
MSRYLVFALALVLAAGSIRAGTVTLSGTCPGNVLESNAFFTLSNSGNDTAFNLALTLHVLGAGISNETYHLTHLNGTNKNTKYSNTTAEINITQPSATVSGSYPGYMGVAYEQGTDYFTAVFPCIFSFRGPTTPDVYMSTNVTENGGGDYTIFVSALNPGATEIDSNVSVIIPPTFTILPAETQKLSLAPNTQKNVSFHVSAPAGSAASYSAAVAVEYVEGGEGYAQVSKFVLTPSASQQLNIATMALYAAILAVALLIALLVYVAVVKGGKKVPEGTSPPAA